MRRFLLILAAVCCVAFAKINTARAGLILLVGDTANSQSSLGDFAAEISYTPISSSAGSLLVKITNTAADGFLTAIAFNNPGGIASVTLALAPTDFNLIGGPTFNDTVFAFGYGAFDIGASTGSSWELGGPPGTGLAAGEMGTFQFDFSGSGLDGLTTVDFVNEVAPSSEGHGATYFFVARFQGFSPSGNDKVPAMLSPVPEPSMWVIYVLSAFALMVTYMQRRWRSRNGPYPCHYG